MIALAIGWNSFGLADIVESMIRIGFEVDFFDYPNLQLDTRNNPEMGEKLVKKMAETKYEFVFSTNYFPVVSLACNACKVKYVSWTYDSPFSQLYSRTISYPYNYAFIFDKAVYYDLKKKGAETVYYLPMAAPVARYDSYIPTEADSKNYKGDIVFVGSTYLEERHQLFKYLEDINEHAKGYIEGLIEGQKHIYGTILMDHLIPPSVTAELMRVCPAPYYKDDIQTVEWYYSRYILARRITGIERKEVLNLLAEDHEVLFYTNEETPDMPKVINRGRAGVYQEAPLVYKCAKINLNITLRSIETGIPLRIMDIMACKGFILSNFQADILEHFKLGEDLDCYTDYKDLLKKVDYYLEHDEKRDEMIQSSYDKVQKYHTYDKRIEAILEIIKA